MENRVEYEMRKLNALKVSSIITSLGWPFIRKLQGNPPNCCFSSDYHIGPAYIYPDATVQQEELERKRRLDLPQLRLAKQNAATVAGLVRWAHFKKNPLAGRFCPEFVYLY